MSELGQILKAAREEKNLTLDDLQEITKIQKRYLDAIEKENFDLLPGPFYTRAFIKNIAETLGMDAEQLLRQYNELLPTRPKEQLDTLPRRKKHVSISPSLFGQWVTKILLALFIVLILFIIYFFLVENTPPADQTYQKDKSFIHNPGAMPSDLNPTMSESEQKDEPEPTPEPPKPELTFVKEEKDGKYTIGYYEVNHALQIELDMKTTRGRVWFEIRNGKDGEIIATKTWEKGTENKWVIDEGKNIYIKFGATKYMDVSVNGFPIDLSTKPDAYHLSISLKPAE